MKDVRTLAVVFVGALGVCADAAAFDRGAPTFRTVQAGDTASSVRSIEADLKGLKTMQTERGLVITLGDVLFASNQTTLKPGAAGTLEQIAKFMRKHPERRVLIEGHTDARGPEDYNLQLSERRAAAVRDALIQRQIDPRRIETIGFGETYPIGDNDTAAGMQKNRRVEIVISDENGRFPGLPEHTAAVRGTNEHSSFRGAGHPPRFISPETLGPAPRTLLRAAGVAVRVGIDVDGARGGKQNGERAAFAEPLALDGELAAVLFHEVLRDRETEAEALVIVARCAQPPERREHAPEILGAQAGAVVLDRHCDVGASRRHA